MQQRPLAINYKCKQQLEQAASSEFKKIELSSQLRLLVANISNKQAAGVLAEREKNKSRRRACESVQVADEMRMPILVSKFN